MNQYSAEPEDVRKENFKTKNQNESKILEIFEKQSKSKNFIHCLITCQYIYYRKTK